MFYHLDFTCRDDDPLQRTLNRLYDYERDISTKVLHRSRLNLFELILRDLRRRGAIHAAGSALDIGCNAGVYAKMISDHGFARVVGIDIVPAMIATAEREFGSREPGRALEFRVQDAVDLDRRERFDFVLCTEVIEHTDDPLRVVDTIGAVLAPGGLAVISLPNRLSLPFLTEYLAHTWLRRPVDPCFEQHLQFPFYRSLGLFSGPKWHRLATDGTNLFWDGPILKRVYRTSLFPSLNRLNFRLSRTWPLKYFTQFFFQVLRRTGEATAIDAPSGPAP